MDVWPAATLVLELQGALCQFTGFILGNIGLLGGNAGLYPAQQFSFIVFATTAYAASNGLKRSIRSISRSRTLTDLRTPSSNAVLPCALPFASACANNNLAFLLTFMAAMACCRMASWSGTLSSG